MLLDDKRELGSCVQRDWECVGREASQCGGVEAMTALGMIYLSRERVVVCFFIGTSSQIMTHRLINYKTLAISLDWSHSLL